MGAFDGGRLVAQAALVPANAFLGGEERLVSELVESRGAGSHPEAWAAAVTALLEEHMGLDGDLVVHGFPGPDEWRLAKGGPGFEVVRTQTQLVREVGEGEREAPEEVELLERFDHQARWLWDRCAGGFELCTVRDEAFLNWRFVERPDREYTCLGVRDGEGVLRGYAVVGGHDPLGGDALVIVDWLVPPDEVEVGDALRRAVLARARTAGRPRVRMLLPEWSPWFEAFQRWGFLVLDAGRFHAARSRVKRFDMIWLRNGWWATGADTLVF